MYIRVETASGHPGYPGHILSRSTGSDPVYKISRSDPDSACVVIMASIPDKIACLTIIVEVYLLILLQIFL